MRSHGHLYRLATAFLISVGLNVILFAVDFSIDPRREELSAIQRWVVGLLSPAEALTTGLVPGHGGLQIVCFDCVLRRGLCHSELGCSHPPWMVATKSLIGETSP